jgi:hypothetical protein
MKRFADFGTVGDGVEKREPDGGAGHDRVVQPVGDALHHRAGQRIMGEDRGMNERRKLRLLPHHGLGFGTNARPHRIGALQRRNALRLGHGCPPA